MLHRWAELCCLTDFCELKQHRSRQQRKQKWINVHGEGNQRC